jgi:hypothetical protein
MRVGYAIRSHHMADECFDAQLGELTRAACGCLFTDQPIRGKITDRPGLSSALDYLRGCLKSLGCCEPTQHETRHREINHRFTALGQPFIVFAQAA